MFWTAVKLCASARTAAASGLHEASDLAMLTCTQEKRGFFAQVANRGTGVLHQGSRSFFKRQPCLDTDNCRTALGVYR